MELSEVTGFLVFSWNEELRDIDRLWLKYSKNHFGLSVQKEIYLREGGKLDYDDWDAYQKMSEVIGWRRGKWLKYDSYTFNTNAQKGHLPSLYACIWLGGAGLGWRDGGVARFLSGMLRQRCILLFSLL